MLSGLIDGPHVFYSDGSVEEGPLILTDYLHDPQTARQLSLVTGIGSHPGSLDRPDNTWPQAANGSMEVGLLW